jgi:hypothetical protein
MNLPTSKDPAMRNFCRNRERASALWRFLEVSKFRERGISRGVFSRAGAFGHRKQRNIAMTTIRSGRLVLGAAAVLALALIAGPAIGAPTGAAPTSPAATMPNSNPYTPEHGTNSQGGPAPDTANPYQPASPLTPIPNCPPGAMCAAPPGTAPTPPTVPTSSPQPPCVPSATKACPN